METLFQRYLNGVLQVGLWEASAMTVASAIAAMQVVVCNGTRKWRSLIPID